jgi:hypothetical protein
MICLGGVRATLVASQNVTIPFACRHRRSWMHQRSEMSPVKDSSL